jgi:hypothetical protein
VGRWARLDSVAPESGLEDPCTGQLVDLRGEILHVIRADGDGHVVGITPLRRTSQARQPEGQDQRLL